MVIKHVERRVRLSDSHIKKLRAKDKLFSVGDSEVPGLRIYVETSGTKNFYYCYKPKNEKNWMRMLMDYIEKHSNLSVEWINRDHFVERSMCGFRLVKKPKIEPPIKEDEEISF